MPTSLPSYNTIQNLYPNTSEYHPRYETPTHCLQLHRSRLPTPPHHYSLTFHSINSLLTEANTGADGAAKRDTDVDNIESSFYYIKSDEQIYDPVTEKRSPNIEVYIFEYVDYYLKSSEQYTGRLLRRRSKRQPA